VRDMRLIDSGGHAYLHRDVPLFFSDSASEISLPDSRVTLRFSEQRAGRQAPIRPIPDQGGYNALIGRGDSDLPRLACFGAETPEQAPLCLFHDPGRRCE